MHIKSKKKLYIERKKIKTTFECIRVISSRIDLDKVDSEFAAVLKNKSEEKGN
jgi:hypothetical protein